jgi:hypothetical protein
MAGIDDVKKAALDLAIAAKQAPAPVQNQQQAIGGHDFLHMEAEALVATAHFIVAAARFQDPKVADALKTLSDAAKEKNLSLDDLLKARRALDK